MIAHQILVDLVGYELPCSVCVDVLVIDQLNMESVVQCIRTSKNPQTHQHALLLLKTTARLYPVSFTWYYCNRIILMQSFYVSL